jgi:valyl-tRNA synthetase
VPATIVASTAERAAFWRSHAALIGGLPGTRLGPIDVSTSADHAQAIAAVAGGVELLIPAEGLFDIRAEGDRAEREHAEAAKQVQRLEGLLASEFSRKAAPETVQRERERLDEQRERLAALERRRATLARLR